MDKNDKENLRNRAAAYVRMSTEHQQYSTSNQMDVILEYAKRRGLEIVKIYSDEGKSGLNIEGREALSQMLEDVRSGRANFSCILVYDVSRWGRFQDADESAHYEYTCRNAGVAVHFCTEQLLIDQSRQRKTMLKMGEHKSIQTDRVILVRGPDEEVETVQWIYRAFIDEGKNESEIADLLNAKGIVTDFGRVWTRSTVHQVLTNEKYIGNNVYHRTSFKLKRKHVENPPDKWVRAAGVFECIIEPEQFFTAREIILTRCRRFSDEELLEKLRGLLSQHGQISGILIDETEGFPSSAAFRHRFGSLISAYRLIGYDPEIDYSFIEINRQLRKQHPEIVASVIQKIESLGASAAWDESSESLWLNGELHVSIVLCRHTTTFAGSSRWLIRLDAGLKPDITIAVRMDATNEGIRDYYLLPGIDMTWENLRVAEDNGFYLDAYRFETLDYFFNLTQRIKILEAA